MTNDIYDSAGAYFHGLLVQAATDKRNESAQRVDWADQSEEARERYRRDEARRIEVREARR